VLLHPVGLPPASKVQTVAGTPLAVRVAVFSAVWVLLAFAAPASAATVTHSLNHTFVVGAEWQTSTVTSLSDTIVSAVTGSETFLFVDQFTNFAD
jgi:hypothetical protein